MKRRKEKYAIGQVVYVKNGTGASYGRITCKWPEAIGNLRIAWRYKVLDPTGLDTTIRGEKELQRLTKRERGPSARD